MSLEGKLKKEMEYYDSKSKDVETEISELEKKVSDAEVLLDSVLDEVEIGENLLGKIMELKGEKDGRN